MDDFICWYSPSNSLSKTMAKYQWCVYLKHTTFQENNLKEGKKSHMFIGNKLVNRNGPMNLKTKIKANQKT